MLSTIFSCANRNEVKKERQKRKLFIDDRIICFQISQLNLTLKIFKVKLTTIQVKLKLGFRATNRKFVVINKLNYEKVFCIGSSIRFAFTIV
jgi:hypothetical protein